jgi:hypothetical protein
MKRPRVRISTLMLLVVIAALVVALAVERRRSDRLKNQAELARLEAVVAEINAKVVAQQMAASITPNVKPGAPTSPK